MVILKKKLRKGVSLMMNLNNLSPSDFKSYITGLKDEENKQKLVTIIVICSFVIGILVVGVVYLIKSRGCDCGYDYDDEWDDDECCDDECCDDDECCCTDRDVDKSVKVKKIDE